MIISIPLNKIQPNPWQTRIGEPDPEYIRELAQDIAEHGLLQMPVGRAVLDDGPLFAPDQTWIDNVMPTGRLTIQLAFGHNRLAAYKWLYDLRDNSDIPGDYSTMPIDIRTLTDEQMAEVAWSENEQRRDVTPIERARAIERRMADFGWSQQDVAEHLGLARPTVSNILRLLKLPEEIQTAVSDGRISARVASALLPMYDLPEETLALANRSWGTVQPKRIVEGAMRGESSDVIRDYVEQVYRTYNRKLQTAEFGLDELFPENLTVSGYDLECAEATVYCGLCRTCDRRLKHDGNICLDISCFKAKTVLRRRRYLAEASAASGYEISDPNKGGNVTRFSAWSNRASFTQILATRCSNLRLVYTERTLTQDDTGYVSEYPHAQIVCDKRNDSCTCIKGLVLAARAPAPAAVEYDESLDPESEEYDPDLADPEDFQPTPAHPPVRAQTAADLEGIARQARREKRDVPEALEALKDKLQALAIDWLKAGELGALYALDHRSSTAIRMTEESVYKHAAWTIATVILGNVYDVESVDDLYHRVNIRLGSLLLPEVSRSKTLVDVLAGEEDN